MTDVSGPLLDAVHAAEPCLVDIRALATKLAPLPPAQIEPLLLRCVDDGDDRAVSRLLQACALNEVKLDPTVLCRCVGVCEDILDSAPCFGLQDASAVQALLAAIGVEVLSVERKLYAAHLAAELTVKFHLDPQPVRKVLWKYEHAALPSDYKLLIAQALQLLEQDSTPNASGIPRWTEFQPADLLPEHPPRATVGGDYTVRRPVPKLGRNDPCHCGSGKKYKKCCYGKDQALLRDASPYAGTTRSELKNRPGLVDDPAVIYDMRPYELKRLKPSELGENQLLTGYQCALQYGLRELAFAMLVECESRPSEREFDRGHFEDLIERVLEAGDLDLACKIRDHCGANSWYRPHAIQFRFDLLENPERFEPLEHDCRQSMCGAFDETIDIDEPLIRLVYDCASRYPALAVVLARAAIASNPNRDLDNAMLLDVIRDARVDLDLEPWNDPAESLFDWIEDQNQLKEKAAAENAEVERLSRGLQAARAALSEKKRALHEMEQRVEALARKADQAPEPRQKADAGEQDLETTTTQDREATLQRLRFQVAGLKAEIGEQQEQRGQLRRMLEEERRKLSALSKEMPPTKQVSPETDAVTLTPSGKPTLPDYTDAFRKTLESVPPPVAAKAILAAGRFAALEPAIWQQTTPIKRLPEHYRIRLSADYRMIVRWRPGKSLRILDVIPRQDLESWIKRHS